MREAGCGCIAELGTKVFPNCLRKHMIGVLLECFQHDSFLGNLEDCIPSVRLEAAVAINNFLKTIVSDIYIERDRERERGLKSLVTIIQEM